jgi:hypothetical protein
MSLPTRRKKLVGPKTANESARIAGNLTGHSVSLAVFGPLGFLAALGGTLFNKSGVRDHSGGKIGRTCYKLAKTECSNRRSNGRVPRPS